MIVTFLLYSHDLALSLSSSGSNRFNDFQASRANVTIQAETILYGEYPLFSIQLIHVIIRSSVVSSIYGLSANDA